MSENDFLSPQEEKRALERIACYDLGGTPNADISSVWKARKDLKIAPVFTGKLPAELPEFMKIHENFADYVFYVFDDDLLVVQRGTTFKIISKRGLVLSLKPELPELDARNFVFKLFSQLVAVGGMVKWAKQPDRPRYKKKQYDF